MRIEQSGERLVLRATLPPKPESAKSLPFQQRIYLGVRANPAGLQVAEAEAKKVGGAIARGDFSWEPYIKVRSSTSTIRDWIEKFEEDYFDRKARSPASETTWKKDYQSIFNRLPQSQPIGAKILKSVVLTTKPDTKTRQRACMALGALARFAQVDFDAKRYKGSYSSSKVEPRDLPSDREIIEWRDRFTNSSWRWAYGMLATFGLRGHEIFYCESIDGKILTLTGGKTGGRKVWACYPEWVEEWNLSQFDVPQVSGRTNSDLGHRVTQCFRRSDAPLVAYDLRHCWARRVLEFGLDVTLAAQQMGHSTQVHTDRYLAWIGEETHQRAYDILMQRPDRPQPPLV